MKKKLLVLFSITTLIVLGLFINTKFNRVDKMDQLRKQHLAFLKNNPFKETLQLSKEERIAKGIPPNKYYEEMWNLTMDPSDGKPHPERLYKLQERLKVNRVPGENTNNWVERGPNNVGGRTRAVMFDPNDATNKRVFAGGVSGGLWVNNDITNANSAWTEVGIPQNLAVSCITYDPNNTNIFYVGTGESYVAGAVNGNGLWRSTDGGVTWAKVFGGITGVTNFETNAILTVNTPAGIAGDYPALSTKSSDFGVDLTAPLTGNLVLVNDGTGTTDDGCEALINGAAISGNIAVIRRGSCSFTLKVQNAEAAGAVAVVVVNNVSGPPISMGGTAAGIGIPSVMISRDDGNAIIAQLASGVNATMKPSGSGFSGFFVTPGIQHINDVVVRNLGGGISEVYVAVGESFYSDSSPIALLGVQNYGLFKSTNGTAWSEVTLPTTSGGNKYVINDIETGADNTIWLATTGSLIGGDGGGTILSSADGTTFTVKHTIANGKRTQIETSATNANRVYVLVEKTSGTDKVQILRTDDSFASNISFTLPNDVDTGIPATDFTRGQAFYDLMLKIDPLDDKTIYVGGIDLFKSTNADVSDGLFILWSQISKWSNNNNLAGLNVPLVHADQHAVAFGNNSSFAMLFGNDGGVYYSNDSGVTISERNKNYNTLQFYKGAIGSDPAAEKLLAGAQDNGSQLINNATVGINSSSEIFGGDGAYVFIDKDNQYMVSSYVYNTYGYHNYSSGIQVYSISNDQSTGSFINPAGLDSSSNSLYTNGSTNTTNQIFRYALGTTSATKTTLTDALLTGKPTVFKSSTFTNTLFVGTDDGKLLKITDVDLFFRVWTDITGPDFYGSISCIELGATENDIYVTFYNYGVTNIFYTNDGGTTWQNKEGNFPDIPVRAILPNPLNANEVIIGTDLGVWATPDFSIANPTWYQSQNGMKDAIVTSFDLRLADNTVLASTYGRGMFTGQFTAAASSLSVDEYSQNNLIKIYPTVSDGNLTIKTISDVREGNLSVFDINGRNVYASKLNFDNDIEKPISLNLSSGVYIAKFESGGLKSSHKIIIK